MSGTTAGPTPIERELHNVALSSLEEQREEAIQLVMTRHKLEEAVVDSLQNIQQLDRDLDELSNMDAADPAVQRLTAERTGQRSQHVAELVGRMNRLPRDDGSPATSRPAGFEALLTNIAVEVTPTNYGPNFSRGVADRVAWLRLVAAGRIDLEKPLGLRKAQFVPNLLPAGE